MWDQYLRRWLDLLFWWVPRQPQQQGPKSETSKREGSAGPRSSEPSSTAAKPGPRGEAAPEAAPRRPEGTGAQPTAPSAESQPSPKPGPATSAEPKPKAADDLTEIKGIGPAVQEKLNGLGITNFAELAKADPAQITEQLKGSQPITEARVRGWIEAAAARQAR